MTRTAFSSKLLVAALLILVGVALGSWWNHAAPSPDSPPSLLSSPGCYLPLTLLVALLALALLIAAYYSKLRLDAQVRVWRARAAAEEAHVQRQLVELDDLTPGPDGQEVARLLRVADQLLLVRPDVVTSPITLIDPHAASRPDRTPDQLALSAILGSAFRHAGQLAPSRSSSSLDSLALLMAAGRWGPGWSEGRVPDHVRVLSEEEVQLLESGEEA